MRHCGWMTLAGVVTCLCSSHSVQAGDPPSVRTTFCSTSNAMIPDGGPDPLLELLPDAAVGPILDLNVHLTATHGSVGDLVITLTHIDTGTAVLLVDRPMRSESLGDCDSNDLSVMLDDAGTGGSINMQCGADTDAAFPTSPPSFTPAQPLAAFNGESMAGQWLISVLDSKTGDAGLLTSWCIEATLGPADLDFGVSAALDSGAVVCGGADDLLIVAPGANVRICYAAGNTGQIDYRTQTLSSSVHGELFTDDPTPLAPGDSRYETATLHVTADVDVEATWSASAGGGGVVSRTDGVLIRIDSDGDGVADVDDGCPSDPDKIEPGQCGCGVDEDACGGGNNNNNDNSNTNGNGNDNGNSNGNDNGNSNGNTNGNDNDNSNGNDNSNDNGNSNGNDNSNDNGNTNGNDNSNDNGSPNGNENGNANNNQNSNTAGPGESENGNSNGNNNSNGNSNNGNGNNNTNGNTSGDSPVLQGCPGDFEVTALSSAGIYVNYDLPTALGDDVTITADPMPGDFLPVGDTHVTIEAQNGAGVDTCEFTITVLPPGSLGNDCFLALCGQGLCGTGGAMLVPFGVAGLLYLRRERRRGR